VSGLRECTSADHPSRDESRWLGRTPHRTPGRVGRQALGRHSSALSAGGASASHAQPVLPLSVTRSRYSTTWGFVVCSAARPVVLLSLLCVSEQRLSCGAGRSAAEGFAHRMCCRPQAVLVRGGWPGGGLRAGARRSAHRQPGTWAVSRVPGPGGEARADQVG
jgi:hypothetical protein